MSEQGLTREQLNTYIQGYAAFQFLTSGVELGVFDLLAETPEIDAQEIAKALQLEAQPLRILLTGLVALKLVHRNNDRYVNDPMIDPALLSGPRSMSPVLRWIKQGINRGLTDMTAAIRENRNVGVERFSGDGNTIYQRLEHEPELEKIFHDCLSLFAMGAPAALGKLAAFEKLSHILDVGGGDGTHAITLARAFPNLKITIFDSPGICDVADKKIAASGLSDRIATHAGDFFTDEFPTGVDGVFLSELTPIWSPQRNLGLFAKAHRVLPPGGALVILSVMLNDTEDGPLGAALFSPYFLTLASGEGMAYPAADYHRWLNDSGFSDVQSFVTGLPLNQTVVVGTK